jgi:hypothetical protein
MGPCGCLNLQGIMTIAVVDAADSQQTLEDGVRVCESQPGKLGDKRVRAAAFRRYHIAGLLYPVLVKQGRRGRAEYGFDRWIEAEASQIKHSFLG